MEPIDYILHGNLSLNVLNPIGLSYNTYYGSVSYGTQPCVGWGMVSSSLCKTGGIKKQEEYLFFRQTDLRPNLLLHHYFYVNLNRFY